MKIITILNPIKYTKSCKSIVTEIFEGLIPKYTKEKGENISRILKESRAPRIISGIATNITGTIFGGSRSCIQLFAISSECLSRFVLGNLFLSRIIPPLLILISVY